MAGGFDELRIVERDEGLERRVRALANHRADFARWSIEDVHRCWRSGPLPECVHAAAIEGGTGVLLVITRVATDHCDGFPDAGRLVGFNAGTPDFIIQQSAG